MLSVQLGKARGNLKDSMYIIMARTHPYVQGSEREKYSSKSP